MPIVFSCSCGKSLRVADEHAGRRVKCPACNVVGFVPGGAEPEFEVVEKEPPPPPKAVPAKAKPAVEDDDDDDVRGYGVAKPTREEEEAEEEKEREKERRKRRKKWQKRPARERSEDNSSRSFEGNAIHAGVAGGILMMLIAVVWLVVGLYHGWLFYYPPVLFIVGFIAFIKGLMGED